MAAVQGVSASEPSASARFDVSRPEIQSFIEQLASQGLDRNWVTGVLAAAESQPKIIDAMSRPAEKTLQWWEYRAHMLTALRIEGGVQLWLEHKELLDRIALEYQAVSYTHLRAHETGRNLVCR